MTEREKKIRRRLENATPNLYYAGCGTINGNNLPLLEHAPEDIRYLLDEVERLRGQLAEVRGLLDDAFDPDAHDSADLYDAQGVNQAHRVAAGGFAPRDTVTD